MTALLRSSSRTAASHLAKAVGKRPAYCECFRPRLELDERASVKVARRRRDLREVDDRAAVNLPESVRIQRFPQLLERRSNQRFALGGKHAGVLVVGLEITDILDRDEPHLVADGCADP